MAKLSADGTYVTVESGDSLSAIAANYGNGKTYQELAKLNNISNPNYNTPGQTIKLTGTADPVKPNTTNTPEITHFGLQANTPRTFFAVWKWDKPEKETKNYEYIWSYYTDNGVWFEGSRSTTTAKDVTYSAPENAKKVKFKVKPIANTYQNSSKVETAYFTANWSTEKVWNLSDNPPLKPTNLSFKIVGLKAECESTGLDQLNATQIHFQILKDYYTPLEPASNTTIRPGTGYARYTRYIEPGHVYRARARTSRDGVYSDWYETTDGVNAIPSAPEKITKCEAKSKTSVFLEWTEVASATTYEIEYATKKDYLGNSNQSTTQGSIKTTTYELGGLETGEQYFFRVRAINDAGESGWTEESSVVIGTKPNPPTTWSSSSTVIVGESMNLYWVHNSEDGSSQTFAQIEIKRKSTGKVEDTITVQNSTDEDEKDKTSVYHFDTTKYPIGEEIYWRVRTRGITDEYSDYSMQRTITINAPATLELIVTDAKDQAFTTLTSFPIRVRTEVGPSTQTAIGYHFSIVANDSYESSTDIGSVKMVAKGETVYSRYLDVYGNLSYAISAGDVHLENNVNYTLKCSVTTDAGMTVEETFDFKVGWSGIDYEPNAEIGVDRDSITTWIRPYCKNSDGVLISNVTLSVYRREYDGRFTELISGIDNVEGTFITDPHPALDYARYRVVATSTLNGTTSYCDLPGYPVQEKAVIIQWGETWTTFEAYDGNAVTENPWSGSLLRLPYNIDVSEERAVDASLIEYIGREHPVSYYGTHVGESATWNVDIPKYDRETLYALRRLSIWHGDVYVREPSGVGYWANIKVSLSQKHLDTVIPVTLNITRVEGGE